MRPPFDFAAQSIIDEGRCRREDVEAIKLWLQTQQDLPDLSEEQIVCFLLSCDNDQEATRVTITAHYKYKKNLPEIFDNRNVDDQEEVKFLLKVGYYVLLPFRTSDGAAIIYYGVKKPVSGRHTAASMKIWFMLLDTIYKENPPSSLIILCDLKKLGLMHLTTIRIGYLRNFIQYLQEGLPLKLRRIYVLNVSSFVNLVKSLVRPFMREEVFNMVCFVQPNSERELLGKEVGLEVLPRELGGALPSVDVLHERTVERLRGMRRFFDAEEHQRHAVKHE